MTTTTVITPPTRVLVWDLPTRLLHWLLAASFGGAFAVALLVRHRDPLFPLHMLLGAVAGLVVVLRLAWGFLGSRYARFRSFAFGPRDVFRYLRSAITGRGEEEHVGHNPANAWVAYALLASTLGTAVTGALMGIGGRAVRQIHPAFAWTTVALVAVHVAGVVLHTLRRRENIALGMLDGKKLAAPPQAIASAHPLAALAMVALVGVSAGLLVNGYDASAKTVTVPVLGQAIRLPGSRTASPRRPDARPKASRPSRGGDT
jgi:cytochrome b